MINVQLENENLTVKLLPELGGKIISFFLKDQAFELAAEAEKDFSEKQTKQMRFFDYAFGMDESFPNIDAEEVTWKGRKLYYPDHGEIWSHAFRILEQNNNSVRLGWKSAYFSYYYEKTLLLEEKKLRIHYRIVNVGEQEFPCIWTWHGLVHYEEDMRIILPEEIRRCRNVLSGTCLGRTDAVLPVENSMYDFRSVPKKGTKSMVKYYGEEKVKKGCCGFIYPSQNVECILQYDAQALPYVGVWITAGGLQGAHNCALEPSSGFYDSISKAKELGKLPVLSAGEKMEFELSITLNRISA